MGIVQQSLLALCLGLAASAAPAEEAEEPPEPTTGSAALAADAVLDQVLQRLPIESLQVTGELRADARDGKPGRRCRVQLLLEYGANPPRARYTILDAFGGDLEQMTLLRPAGGPPRWLYARGYPLAEAPAPDAAETIQGTDLAWSDLGLAFLWWRPARLVGEETVLDRPCYILEAPAPAGEHSPYALTRMWIDRRHLMLLRADGCDADGTARRRLAVKSIKKIDGEWMVKDLDVTTLDTRLRTSLRIAAVEKPEGAAPRR